MSSADDARQFTSSTLNAAALKTFSAEKAQEAKENITVRHVEGGNTVSTNTFSRANKPDMVDMMNGFNMFFGDHTTDTKLVID